MMTARRNLPALAALTFMALAAAIPARAEGDPAAGKKAFRKCAACHTVEAGKHRIGPSLAGIVGRTPGTVEGFKYSPAMVEFGAGGKTWDEATLDAYLADPKGFIKGNKMAFPGMKNAGERADVIAYLKSANGQ